MDFVVLDGHIKPEYLILVGKFIAHMRFICVFIRPRSISLASVVT